MLGRYQLEISSPCRSLGLQYQVKRDWVIMEIKIEDGIYYLPLVRSFSAFSLK
jgi:hypothetical protein